MLGIKKELKRKPPLRISVNELTLNENMNLINVKTEQGFLNLIGDGIFFVLKRNSHEVNYGFNENICLVYEGKINLQRM